MAGHLWENEELRTVQLEAPTEQQLTMPVFASPIAAVLVSTWNQYGGLLGALCNVVGVDHGSMVGTLQVESGGRGAGPDGRMMIRFENHLFARFLGNDEVFNRHFAFGSEKAWEGHFFRNDEVSDWFPCHTSQTSEWEILQFARALADDAALNSISMGVSQVMGFNASAIGYPSVHEMFDHFSSDIRYQILGMFDYIRGPGPSSPMIDALRTRNYEGFAFGYNGPGQAGLYGGLIRNAVLAFEQLQGSGGSAVVGISGSVVHTVQPGESLGRIAAKFGVTVQALAAENGIANPDLVPAGQVLRIPGQAPAPATAATAAAPAVTEAQPSAPAAEERLHVVQPGETLGAIAARFGVPLQAIVEANGIANPDMIPAGQPLRIPAPVAAPREMRRPRSARGAFEAYVVAPGDTLESIADELKTTVAAISATNEVLLLPGQVLGIPR